MSLTLVLLKLDKAATAPAVLHTDGLEELRQATIRTP
jgi:hypothetical protein